MGWRVYIDYRKINEATAKDHFPLPFMDQMLERLAGNKYFCFLDGFSGYFQIPIDPMDQEKATFMCHFGTFACRRMPFGLCNALATFQRCMLAIFHDMIEESVEVFMDDFSVFGSSFNNWLNNLDKMLQHCKDANLFDIEIKDKKSTENVAADHLSRIEKYETTDDSEVDDNFPEETLMEISTRDIPWFADFANYLVVGDYLIRLLLIGDSAMFRRQSYDGVGLSICLRPMLLLHKILIRICNLAGKPIRFVAMADVGCFVNACGKKATISSGESSQDDGGSKLLNSS
ncbi:reverse transcriptase domain-containing protein [Tanacetum coccineum]